MNRRDAMKAALATVFTPVLFDTALPEELPPINFERCCSGHSPGDEDEAPWETHPEEGFWFGPRPGYPIRVWIRYDEVEKMRAETIKACPACRELFEA
jgi:hypothetical protein